MASLWRRAMVYLGLQDDDEFAYDTEYEYGNGDEDRSVDVGPATRDPRRRDVRTHSAPDPRQLRDAPVVRDPRVPPEPREPEGVTVRPMARDDAADMAPQRSSVERIATSPRVHVVEPRSFNDIQEVGDRVKANQPVILNLQGRDRELQRRLIDFSSGLAYAVGGKMERVNDQVFLLTPSNVEVAPAEKERLQARGLYRS
jgi:cell division inhibitor SepF